ncbi:Sec-independent protein translocase subunit TatA [Actinophytocola sp.]|uniref:Sec-independent protein translocase subunit TatA n=1 Tax=Actinophytocola sp. TaxID=1872138 RepID=UPI003D6A01CB
MTVGNLGVPELLIIAGVIILLFGARKLPEMARSLGKSAKAFKEETKGMRGGDEQDDKDAETPAAPPAQSATQQQLPEAQPQTPAQTPAQTNGAQASGAQANGAAPVEQAQQNKNSG